MGARDMDTNDLVRLRVLHFGRFYNDQFGGLERHVDTLLRGLEPYCVSDNLVAHDKYAEATVPANGYTVYKTPSLGKLASTALCPTMPLWARRLHRQHDYELVHLHFPDPMAHLASTFLPRDVKRVITWHSDIVRQKRLLRFYRPFLNRIVNQADAIIVPTPRHLEASPQLTACRYPERIQVVPFGLDYAPLDEAACSSAAIAALRTRLAGDAPLLFTVGRHVYYKGLEFLIRAMADIPYAILVVGGEGPLTPRLRALAETLGLTARIRFVGRIPDTEMPFYYHACDVFCMPSVAPAEAFGLVQLEAMACGKPVVCCELHNGVTYVNRHGETGLVVPPRDPEALAEALNRLLNDPELRVRLGEQGRRRVRAEFSVESMVAGTLRVYEQVLGRALPMRTPRDSLADIVGRLMRC
jgi:rhamnosyl/mannosyltransferase